MDIYYPTLLYMHVTQGVYGIGLRNLSFFDRERFITLSESYASNVTVYVYCLYRSYELLQFGSSCC